MDTSLRSFYSLWQDEHIRETLFELLAKEDVCAVRLANSACCNLVTKRLFMRTHLTFTANTFTKASRVHALARIGHHIEHLTFSFAHSDATFLPPLIHPITGREINFLYTPHTCMMSVLTRPKYANTELGDILTQQYPPLFHAATNVPSFLNAIKHMPNMRHLTIRCPGQEPKERYRRDIVDYALISLRISIERAPLHKLCKLSLSGVHPAAFNYLRHVPGFGSHPSAARRWRQIRKLYMSVDTWDFHGPSPGLDHLKIIDDYIRNMAPHLEKFSFSWVDDNGSGIRKGPCPIALSGDPLFTPRPGGPKKLFNEVTGPMSPLPPAPQRETMHLPRLRCLTLRNATMNTPQLRDLVERHRPTVREFDFENVTLVDGGSYEEAFAHLLSETAGHGSSVWSRNESGDKRRNANGARPEPAPNREQVDGDSHWDSCPTGFGSPMVRQSFRVAADSPTASLSSRSSNSVFDPAAVAAPDDIELASPSAAVAAVSRELLDLDIEDLESYLGLSLELPFMLDSPSDVSSSPEVCPFMSTRPSDTSFVEDANEALLDMSGDAEEDDGELASDIAAEHDASLTFSTRFKKKRIHGSRRKHRADDWFKSRSEENQSRSRRGHRDHRDHRDDRNHGHHSSRHRSRHRNHADHDCEKRRDDRRERKRRETSRSRSQSKPRSSHGRHQDSQKDPLLTSSPLVPRTPPPPPLPTRMVKDHPFAHRTPPPQPHPVIARQQRQPNDDDSDVFRPRTGSEASRIPAVAPLAISAPILAPDPVPVVLQPTVYDPSATVTSPIGSGLVRSKSASSAVSGRSGLSGLSLRCAAQHSAEDDGLSAIQRQILQEHPQVLKGEGATQTQWRQKMADDPEARTSALRKAKEAVLAKLSSEFNKRMGRETTTRESAASAAAAAAATAASVAAAAASAAMSTHAPAPPACYGDSGNSNDQPGHNNATAATLSLLAGLRLRERLFGDVLGGPEPLPSTVVPSAPMGYYRQHHHQSMESNSAVVPLIFSHA